MLSLFSKKIIIFAVIHINFTIENIKNEWLMASVVSIIPIVLRRSS